MYDREGYYHNHRYCPQCGSDELCETTMATPVRWYDDGSLPWRDDNLAICRCGWRGRVDDLVATPPQISDAR